MKKVLLCALERGGFVFRLLTILKKALLIFFACLAVAALFGCGNCGRRCDAGKEKHHRKSSCFEVAACARVLAACAAI